MRAWTGGFPHLGRSGSKERSESELGITFRACMPATRTCLFQNNATNLTRFQNTSLSGYFRFTPWQHVDTSFECLFTSLNFSLSKYLSSSATVHICLTLLTFLLSGLQPLAFLEMSQISFISIGNFWNLSLLMFLICYFIISFSLMRS